MLLESNYIQINTLVQEGKEYNILIFNPHVNAFFIYPDKDECSEVQYINFGMSVSTIIDLKIAWFHNIDQNQVCEPATEIAESQQNLFWVQWLLTNSFCQ